MFCIIKVNWGWFRRSTNIFLIFSFFYILWFGVARRIDFWNNLSFVIVFDLTNLDRMEWKSGAATGWPILNRLHTYFRLFIQMVFVTVMMNSYIALGHSRAIVIVVNGPKCVVRLKVEKVLTPGPLWFGQVRTKF